jgi:hypothetical protein
LLMRGQIARFSITRLMQFADRLQLAVTLTVAPKADSQKPQKGTRIPIRRTGLRIAPAKPAAGHRTAQSRVLA